MPGIVADLQLGSVKIAQRAGIDLSVTYRPLEGSSTVRMSDGSPRKVTIWQGKLAITIRGSGRLPAALAPEVLDYTGSLTLKSCSPRAIPGSSNVITVPAARRTDLSAQVIGAAVLDGFEAVETAVSMGGNVATLTTVSGAVSYLALYFPQLSVIVPEPPEETFDRRIANYRWELECLEA